MKKKLNRFISPYQYVVSQSRNNPNYEMPQKFLTIAPSTLAEMEAILKENYEDEEMVEVLFANFRLYQENRLKINKDSRESKMEQRKEGGGAKAPRSAKMTGVVKLVPVEGSENTFKVEKVSVPVPPKPTNPEEEDAEPLSVVRKRVVAKPKTPEPEIEEDISNNPEALAAAVAEAAAARATATITPAQVVRKYTKKSAEGGAAKPRLALKQGAQARKDAKKEQEEAEQRADSKTGRTLAEIHASMPQRKLPPAVEEARAQAEAWKKSEAERKKAEGIAKRKATLAAKKQELANAAKAESEDSGEETETDVETDAEE
jgi:hypothetical protein